MNDKKKTRQRKARAGVDWRIKLLWLQVVISALALAISITVLVTR